MTVSTNPSASTKNSSRRALLAGALGGLGAVAAGAVTRVSSVRAGVDGDVVLGADNTATSTTKIANATNANAAFHGACNGGVGLWGSSSTSTGIYGTSLASVAIYGYSNATDQPAIRAYSQGSSTGVQGSSGPTSPPAAKPKTGVYGYANQDKDSRGVWGFSGAGAGVMGQANRAGLAFLGRGRVKFEKVSGVATIAAGNTSVLVSPNVNVTHGSFVLLTPKVGLGGRDLWFTTNPSADSITIHLSSSRSSATKIAWLLLG